MRILATACFVLVAGCATTEAPAPFPAEPRAGTVFHAFNKPNGAGPFPAVVLLHTCGGVQPHLFEWMRVLESNGYASVAVDSFTPRGAGACRLPTYYPASVDEFAEDAIAALDSLRKRPDIDPRRIGVMGFSYGASVALRLASPRYHRGMNRFAAAVSFYPVCTLFTPGELRPRDDHLRADVNTPTLILMGADDNDTPGAVASCISRVASLRADGRPIDIKVYPNAGHVFDANNPEATRAATRDLLEFLGRHLGK